MCGLGAENQCINRINRINRIHHVNPMLKAKGRWPRQRGRHPFTTEGTQPHETRLSSKNST